MSALTLALAGAVNVVTALSFGAVATRLLARPPGAHRLALQAIAVWWGCMALLIAFHAAETLAAAAGYLDVTAASVIRTANGILLGLGGWGLCFHVLYLRTGTRKALLPLAAYFAVVGACYIITFELHPFLALEAGAFEVEGVHPTPLEDSRLWTVTVLGVGLPLIAASVSYLLLARRLTRPDQRRRAVLASSGILAWVAPGLVAQAAGGPWADVFTYTIFGLLAAVLVFLAYFPGRAVDEGKVQTADPIEVAAPMHG